MAGAGDDERRVVETYLSTHNLSAVLNDVVNDVRVILLCVCRS
jgi:hypothetical protein